MTREETLEALIRDMRQYIANVDRVKLRDAAGMSGVVSGGARHLLGARMGLDVFTAESAVMLAAALLQLARELSLEEREGLIEEDPL